MPVLAYGQMHLTPITLRTSASLSQIRNAMRRERYEGQVPGGGFGGVDDDNYALRQRGLGRPQGGDARIEPADGEWKRRLLARYYWNELDRHLEMYDEIDSALRWDFTAADIMITETDAEGEFVAYISMKPGGRGFQASVSESLRALLEEIDGGSTISLYGSPVGFGDDDFFRWLLYRLLWDRDIELIELRSITAIAGQDALSRGATLSNGVDVDGRPELLAMLSGKNTFFGPAKIQIFDTDLQLDATLELRQDGGLSPVVNSCRYVVDPPAPSVKRMKLVNDLIFATIPSLRSAYYADSEYRKGGRQKLMNHCRDVLRKALDEDQT